MTQLAAKEIKPSAAMLKPLGVLVIGRKRPGFDQEWNDIIRGRSLETLRILGYAPVGVDSPVVDNATIRAAIDDIRDRGCRAIVVLQPSLGDGQLSFTLMQHWQAPVVLWATPERQDSEKVSSCSLVAQHLWCANFRQANHPFELVYGDPHDQSVQQPLQQAIQLCEAVHALRRAKVGQIGSHAPGYISMGADPFTMRKKLGAQLHDLSLVQFIERVRAVAQREVDQDVQRVQAMQIALNGISAMHLEINSRYYLAIRELMAEEQLDALAMQEWPELPNVLGQWPYLAMSRVADEGGAISMEGDTDAALTFMLGSLAGAGNAFITDWLEHDERTINFWHPGTAPLGMCENASLALHFNNGKPIVIDGELRLDEPVTVARLWRCDDQYHMMAFEGRTVPPRRKLTGNSGLVELTGGDVPQWFDALCHAGMPHHPVLFYGHHRERFRRLARLLNVQWLAKHD